MLKPAAAQPVDSEILEAIPLLAGRPAGHWQFEPMGGITNRTYKVSEGPLSQERGAYVLRIAAESTGYLDRAAEAHNARLAGQAGIAPAVLHADARAMVTAYLAGARPLTYADLGLPEHLEQVAATLRRLQQVRAPFHGARHPFGEIDKYLNLHRDPRSLDLRRRAEPVAAALARVQLPAVPAHVDPNPANFLLCADGALRMVDWEFSAMTDPCWDIASILSMLPYDAARMRRFSEAIVGQVSDAFLARVALFRTAMYLVAGSWCAMEAAFRNDGALRQMAEGYLDRCAEALAHPELPRWLSGQFPSA
jgi:thiamine kinase-like enzyme